MSKRCQSIIIKSLSDLEQRVEDLENSGVGSSSDDQNLSYLGNGNIEIENGNTINISESVMNTDAFGLNLGFFVKIDT